MTPSSNSLYLPQKKIILELGIVTTETQDRQAEKSHMYSSSPSYLISNESLADELSLQYACCPGLTVHYFRLCPVGSNPPKGNLPQRQQRFQSHGRPGPQLYHRPRIHAAKMRPPDLILNHWGNGTVRCVLILL